MRAVYRQPIYLAKLKKRDKENIPVHQHRRRDSIQYDLLLFQESLHLYEDPATSYPVTARGNSLTHNPLADRTALFNQTSKPKNRNLDDRLKCEQNKRTTAPIFEKCVFNKNAAELKNIHRTQASIKPNTKGLSETAIHVKEQMTSNCTVSAKQEPVQTKEESGKVNRDVVESKIDEEVPNSPSSQPLKLVKYVQNQPYSSQAIQKAYQKIEQLQRLKSKTAEHIKQLQQTNHLRQKQNQHLLTRIENIEQQFDELVLHHNSLQSLQSVQQKPNEVVSLTFYSEQHTQTDPQPQSTPRQSLYKYHGQGSRSSFELTSQDMLLRAKQLKNQLEVQKIHSSNLQASFKIMLQNKQIQWRQKIEFMQRQIQGLNKRYESKCIEVRQKEQLITRLIHK